MGSSLLFPLPILLSLSTPRPEYLRASQESLSHETIYQMIYQNYQGCGEYWKYLRRGLCQRKSRDGAKSKRGGIPGRVDISERPAIAEQKTEIGHWESDTMIGGNHLGVLVTYMDKASKFLVAGLAKNKTASEINPCHRKTFSADPNYTSKPLLRQTSAVISKQ